ncbi:MAG TPA: hypothetical protein VD790_04185 [Thermoleophilaceae bacterium]|nr:hypothetical protein [Thermoleophilaceae bacterium]
MALIALTVALGGGAYAAIKLPKNSVGKKQLKKGAVTPPKLAEKTKDQLKGEPGPPGTKGATGAPGPPGPGAKLLAAEPVASASQEYVPLGQAGPFTLHTRCRINGGVVDAALVATGPALTADSTFIATSSTGPPVSLIDSGEESAAPTLANPKVVGDAAAASGGNVKRVWTSALLQSASSVAIQAWIKAQTSAGASTDSCRFSAIVTPLE